MQQARIVSPFLLRSFDPPIGAIQQKTVIGIERIGKRIVFAFEDDLFLVLHLMIAGRLHWRNKGITIPAKVGLAAVDFANGTLLLTEAGTQKRASLHLVTGRNQLAKFNLGGLELFEATFDQFHQRLVLENHTLKRALTDPWLFSGCPKPKSMIDLKKRKKRCTMPIVGLPTFFSRICWRRLANPRCNIFKAEGLTMR